MFDCCFKCNIISYLSTESVWFVGLRYKCGKVVFIVLVDIDKKKNKFRQIVEELNVQEIEGVLGIGFKEAITVCQALVPNCSMIPIEYDRVVGLRERSHGWQQRNFCKCNEIRNVLFRGACDAP